MNQYLSSYQDFINSPFQIGTLQLNNRLIQGPLAGFSCAAFRRLFSLFLQPAYCVSEMLSANDVVHKHALESRYLYRAADEGLLCYQIALIKSAVNIPIIVNGDIKDISSLIKAFKQTGGDAFMVARASTGKPWLFQEKQAFNLFMNF